MVFCFSVSWAAETSSSQSITRIGFPVVQFPFTQSSLSEGYQTELYFSLCPTRQGLLSQTVIRIVNGLTLTEPTTHRMSADLYWMNNTIHFSLWLEDTQRQTKGEGRNAYVGCGEATSVGSSLHLNWVKHFINLHSYTGFSFQAPLSHHGLQYPSQRLVHKLWTTQHTILSSTSALFV